MAYAPALNNGFIADDFVLLKYSDNLKQDFLFLFQVPPLNFRMTSIALYGLLKSVFGYRSEYFYVFSILLHFVTALLFWRFLRLITGGKAVAFAGAAMFAVFSNPQEAIMWVTAVHEVLQGLFILCTLLAWLKKRYVLSAVFFFFALFSKESALMVLALVPMLQWQQHKKLFPAAYWVLLLPSTVFIAAFLYTWSTNPMIQSSIYVISPRAAVVAVKTLLHLFWPWLVVLLILFRLDLRRWPEPRPLLATAGAMFVTILPYIFLTYSSYIPSRQLYIVSMVLTWSMASLLLKLRPKLQIAFAAAFFAVNVQSLWFKQDTQFERRAASTTQLLQVLRSHQPTQILIFDFPYPYPDIAKDVSFLVPGWTRDLVGVNGTGETCADCLMLNWNVQTQTFVRR